MQKEKIRIKDIAERSGVSVGTVDRVLHGRSGVSEASRLKVEEILKELDYTPNMYASALASNKKYRFTCLLPLHLDGDYWVDVVKGMRQAVKSYTDFNLTLDVYYYDQYEVGSFANQGAELLRKGADAVIMSPTDNEETHKITSMLEENNIPYVFIDSNPTGFHPLAFYGQHARQSGYFAARMFNMLIKDESEIVIFRQINDGKLGSNQQKFREEGFYSFLQENRKDLKIKVLNFHVKQLDSYETVLDDFFRQNPDVHCGITFNSKSYIIGEYLLKHNRCDFKFVGYDLLRRNVACLKAGSIDFIIAQQPTAQGFNSVQCLFKSLVLKKKVKACNYMPIHLISEDNIDFYLDTHGDDENQLD